MIHGRFGEQTRPFVSASVAMAKAERMAKINFLVDTGADATCLMPADVFALRLNQTDWGEATELRGIGGDAVVYANRITITFADHGNGLVVYETPAYLYPKQEPYLSYPSILGRNMLENWRLHYCQPEMKLTAEVLRHDLLIPLPISRHRPP
jgi:predicted aspartyl protease